MENSPQDGQGQGQGQSHDWPFNILSDFLIRVHTTNAEQVLAAYAAINDDDRVRRWRSDLARALQQRYDELEDVNFKMVMRKESMEELRRHSERFGAGTPMGEIVLAEIVHRGRVDALLAIAPSLTFYYDYRVARGVQVIPEQFQRAIGDDRELSERVARMLHLVEMPFENIASHARLVEHPCAEVRAVERDTLHVLFALRARSMQSTISLFKYSENVLALDPSAANSLRVHLLQHAWPVPEGGKIDLCVFVMALELERFIPGMYDAAVRHALAEAVARGDDEKPPEWKLSKRMRPEMRRAMYNDVMVAVCAVFIWSGVWVEHEYHNQERVLRRLDAVSEYKALIDVLDARAERLISDQTHVDPQVLIMLSKIERSRHKGRCPRMSAYLAMERPLKRANAFM